MSPDSRWIAYDSNESGQFEVYVRPYARTALGRWRVSTSGGRQPLWSRDGKELYFRDFSAALLAVQVTPSSAFTATPPVKLLEGSRYRGGGAQLGGRTYDLSADGSLFLMLKPLIPPGTPLAIVVTENWFSELLARFR